ncbi:MAG: hypothetical protein N3B16_01930 [Candidatus Aminicenantes bacterium]|nr:hypothetical protein [Candidatus Aminicenantes bacterium]
MAETFYEIEFIVNIGSESLKARKWIAEEMMAIVLEGFKLGKVLG